MITLRRILTGAVLLVAASGLASADFIETFSATIPPGQTGTYNFTLPAFNAGACTGCVLEDITVVVSTSAVAEVDVTNLASTPQAFTNATASVPFTIAGPTGLSTTTTVTAGPCSGTATPFPPVYVACSGISATGVTDVSIPSANFGSWTAPPAALSLNMSFTVGSGVYGGSSTPGVVFFGGSASGGGEVTVLYDYIIPTTGTPEPTTMALMGGALLGLGFIGRRLKRS
jgi:PEP-CTERM motif